MPLILYILADLIPDRAINQTY